MEINWWQSFLQIWLSSIAAILTVIVSIYGGWKWIRRLWGKKFLAKPFGKKAKTNFTYNDVLAGVEKLVEPARNFKPEEIVGINRGGAILGGMLGKELGFVPRIIVVDEDNEKVWFNDAEELRGRKVLLVDDRLTDGKHMGLAYDYLQEYAKAKDVRKIVFTWINRPTAVSSPDFWAYEADKGKLLLPWEPPGGALPKNFSSRSIPC